MVTLRFDFKNTLLGYNSFFHPLTNHSPGTSHLMPGTRGLVPNTAYLITHRLVNEFRVVGLFKKICVLSALKKHNSKCLVHFYTHQSSL